MSSQPKPSLTSHPTYAYEEELLSAGHQIVAGVDEVGRGPLAGPVVVAAVILNTEAVPAGLTDSKKLTAKKRDDLFTQIIAEHHVGVSVICARTIDHLNIRGATLFGMAKAINALPVQPDSALVDGRDIPDTTIHCTPLIKGDSRSLSIAAASVVAKVWRDRIMERLHRDHPHFGWITNKGYPSQTHRDALMEFGPTIHHRMSFSPVAEAHREKNARG